ncbi:MAG: DUF354 domain-containing protein [Bacteroidales bacterium]|nr:DUF354 domain-containing protein [Bacteroidales bacterium]
MKILIDIGHPAHVHYFRNFAKSINANGSEILFTCRNKDVTVALLKHYGFRYVNFGKNFKSKLGKIFGLFCFTLRLFLVSLQFKPNMYLNASIYSAIVAWMLRKPHIALEDTFNWEQVKLYLPFTSCILTGDYEHPSLGMKEISFSGYQELLYLHPNNFKPDLSIYKELGIGKGDPYVIIRFVSWDASHDYGHKGISPYNKMKLVKELSTLCEVFISSESALSKDLEPYRLGILPHRMHHALAFASLVIGESYTMLSEAAVLGVPSVLIHNTYCYYLQDQQKKYSLVYNFTESEDDQRKAISKGIEILTKLNNKSEWQNLRQKMLTDKIDVSSFLVWFIENYPTSFNMMKENPDIQNQFKN